MFAKKKLPTNQEKRLYGHLQYSQSFYYSNGNILDAAVIEN